jgi:hypothetical protein
MATTGTDAAAHGGIVPAARLDALDALRGFAILTMALSGLVPRGVWPAWMYHAQLPPPEHAFDPARPGLTWVDLVFPFFLFALGAAIPLALSRRLRAGANSWGLAQHALRRGVLLLGFAIYVQHINPWLIADNPDAGVWLRALLGFALLFPILTRLPDTWPAVWRWGIRTGGVLGAAILCATLRYRDGSGFDPLRSDIIIIVLANVAAVGTLVWLLTRDRVAWRVLVLLVLVAFRLGHEPAGWAHDLWHLNFLPDALRPYALRYAQPYYCQYLHIVIPGTIVGDLLVQRLQQATAAQRGVSWELAIAGTIGLLVNVVVVAGLQARWLTGTAAVGLGLCAVGIALLRLRRAAAPPFELQVMLWATAWLLIGLLLEPYEGGIKKDHSTLSYYYVTASLATFALLALLLAQRLVGRWPLAILVDSGQNPMIAYVGIRNLVPPALALLALLPPIGWAFGQARGLSVTLVGEPVTALLRAIWLTILVGLATMVFTRLKLYWRT